MKASQQLIPVFVDCDWGKKNKDLSTKYNIGGYPTVLFVDAEGNEVAKMSDRSPEGLAKQITEVAEKYKKGPSFIASLEEGMTKGKEDKKPVLLLFVTAKADSEALMTALGDDTLKELLEKFVVVKSEIKKDNEDAKKYSVANSTQPVLFVVDPNAEKPEQKPLKKLTGKKGPKELKKELEGALKKFEDGK